MLPLITVYRTLLIMACCVCTVLLFGCGGSSFFDAPPQRDTSIRADQPPTEVVQKDVLRPTMQSLKSRIRSNEQRLEEWHEVERKTATMSLPQEKMYRIDECRSNVQHILLEYNALQRQLQQESKAEAAQLLAANALLQLNQQDIEYLEGGCGRLLTELKTAVLPPLVATADPQIKAAFDNADYSQVINLYGPLGQVAGQIPAPETTFLYGQALLKNYQEQEANRVLGDLLVRVRQMRGQEAVLLPLLQCMADLYFSLESYPEARTHYEELLRLSIDKGARKEEWAGLQLAALQPGSANPTELKTYTLMVRNYLAYVPKRDGYSLNDQTDKFLKAYPASHLTANVNMIKKTSREQADSWLNQGIKRIEAQAGERIETADPAVAAGTVAGANVASSQPGSPGSPASAVSSPSLPTPNPIAGNASQMTNPAQPTSALPQPVPVTAPAAPENERALKEDYEKGLAHLQAKEYDKAIERFNRLQRTSYEAKARPQLEEASRLGAQDLRQKAAELFGRTQSSRDTDEKRKYLLASRDLLQNILTKYPQSGLTDKVQKNLARIDADLRALDGK
jgi:tetratricopeptide (TPR) repeat protein